MPSPHLRARQAPPGTQSHPASFMHVDEQPLPQKPTRVHLVPGDAQVYPGSTRHMLEQPSLSVELPSSQYSPKVRRPSPQKSLGTATQWPPLPPDVGHENPGSTFLQSAEQP